MFVFKFKILLALTLSFITIFRRVCVLQSITETMCPNEIFYQKELNTNGDLNSIGNKMTKNLNGKVLCLNVTQFK